MQRATRRRGIVVGLALALGSFVSVASPLASVAQTADVKTEPAAVEKEAYYTAEADGAIPATLTNEFPPGVTCVVIPQLCSQQAQTVTGPVDSSMPDPKVPDHQAQQPVIPGELPVGMLGGKPRYTSYVKFPMPAIPKGSFIEKFDLVITQSDLSYALESPAFRQAILTGLVTYQQRTPQAFTEYLASVGRTTPLIDRKITGIELCAVLASWAGTPSQDATTQPARDCVFGANGVFDLDTMTWTFDLSLLAQAWLDGTTPNEGVYLGPLGAENLAFGDADTSTNWQVSLYGKGAEAAEDRPKIRYAFSEGFGDDLGGGGDLGDLGGELTLDDAEVFEDTILPSSDVFPSLVDDSTLVGGDPVDGGGTTTGGGTPRVNTGGEPPITGRLIGQSRPQTPWWLWLLLPAGLGLAYRFERSIEEEPRAVRTGRGALTRLMARDEATTP
ncbi:MAG TPA: hypothetical protein VF230_19035 [Acidimicrobiales bacterium]